MQWILLICAGLLEIGWPLGFKLAGLHEKYKVSSLSTTAFLSPAQRSAENLAT